MGQALKFCRDCDNKRGCHKCRKLRDWVMHSFGNEVKPMTNGDRIRAMSDEDLAELMSKNAIKTVCDIVCGDDCGAFRSVTKTAAQVCEEKILRWLQQPAEEGGNRD